MGEPFIGGLVKEGPRAFGAAGFLAPAAVIGCLNLEWLCKSS